MRQPEDKILSLEQAVAWREDLGRHRHRVGVTNGCFDLLHRGHAEYLCRARQRTDALLVAVNSDASVRQVKGPGRPVVGEADRAYMVASLECVDAVVLFETPKPIPLFRAVVPDIYVKGGDYDESTIDREEHGVLKELGCEFVFVSFVPGFSTTQTIAQVKNGT